MELFDLIDKHDNVIGTTDKKTAHRTGQLHRVGAVFVFDSQGRLFVQIRNSGGIYDHSVGGHISKGETYDEGTAREAREELGITLPLQALSIFYADELPTMQHMFGLYTCVADPAWIFTPNEEVKQIFPMEIQEIRNLMQVSPEKFARGFIYTMNEYVRLIADTEVR